MPNRKIAAGETAVTAAIDEGRAHHAAGRLQEAESAYRQALAAAPNNPDALHLLGVIAHQAGKNEIAVDLISKAISANPSIPDYHNNLGMAHQVLGQPEEAVAAFHRAVALKPDYAEARNNLGAACKNQGRLEEAVAAFRKAVALKPDYAEAHNNLGNALRAQGKLKDAVAAYRRALALKPGYAEINNNLGAALRGQGKLDHAVAFYHRALALKPDYAEAHNNLGNALRAQGKLDEAMAAFQRALDLKPDFTEAHNNLGRTLKDQGRLKEALHSYRRAIEIDPAFVQAHSNLLIALPYDPRTKPRKLAAEHRMWAARHERPVMASAEFPAGKDPERPLRVGFVSPDFNSHPVGFFLEPVLSHHDRSSFEILCYANASRNDEVTTRLRLCASEWRDVAGLSDDDFAHLVRRDAIDILIELTGHQARNRLLALARRPAPLQVAWMGGVNSRGMSSLDYLITDRVHAPAGVDELYTEKLIRMPNGYACYRPPDYAPAISELPALNTRHPTFGSFNNFAKINGRVIEQWAAILRAVPDARLLVKTPSLGDRMTRRHFIETFETAGVARKRLELEGRSPHAGLLARYRDVDIALDPFPYGGGLTTCEALWMGVPVITWPGELPQGRHAASHLTNAGLSEFIAGSADGYVDLAARWANDIPALTELRASLRDRVARSSLCDGATFTSAFEHELRQMWRRRCQADPNPPTGKR